MKKIISLVCIICSFCMLFSINVSAGVNSDYGSGESITNYHTDWDQPYSLFIAQIKYINGDPYPYDSMPYDETLYMIGKGEGVRLLDLDANPDKKRSIYLHEYWENKGGKHFENYKNIVILGDVVYIGNESFELNTRLKDIYIPDSVTEMGKNIFNKYSNPVIHCTNGSAAMKYALENGYAFDAEGYEGITGDLNCDNAMNMKDVLTLRKYIAGIRTKVNINTTDVNGDGAVNIKDVLKLRKLIAGIE